jgi:hypothetical protein
MATQVDGPAIALTLHSTRTAEQSALRKIAIVRTEIPVGDAAGLAVLWTTTRDAIVNANFVIWTFPPGHPCSRVDALVRRPALAGGEVKQLGVTARSVTPALAGDLA